MSVVTLQDASQCFAGMQSKANLTTMSTEIIDLTPINSIDPASKSGEDGSVGEGVLQREKPSQFLQVSPYPEPEHLLNLDSVDTKNRLFAQALEVLGTTTTKYATTEYSKTFNWSVVFTELRRLSKIESFLFPATEFYVVEFRSQLKEIIDRDLLFQLDKESHREATAAGGLLKYWYGSPDADRRNLATCLWRGKADAIEGGKGMWHAQARRIISTTYDSINVRGLRLIVSEGATDWVFEPWKFH